MTEVRLAAETVWLSQEQMAALFGRERSVISKHLRNLFAEGERDEKSNVQNLRFAGSDKPVMFYNLNVIRLTLPVVWPAAQMPESPRAPRVSAARAGRGRLRRFRAPEN